MNDGDIDEQITAARRQLASRLRQLRRIADISGEELGRRAGWGQSTTSRLEKGETMPQSSQVEAWVAAVGAGPEVLIELEDLLATARTSVTSWDRQLAVGRGRRQQRIREFEASVSTIRTFQPTIVPGLLQLPEYMKQVFRFLTQGPALTDEDLASAIQARVERQAILYNPSQRLNFILAEAALWWRPVPVEVQVAQVERVAAATTLSNVTLGVIPAHAQVSASYFHGFTVLGDPDRDEDPAAVVETLTRELWLRDERDVRIYLDEFAKLASDAVYGEDARAVLRRAAADLRETSHG